VPTSLIQDRTHVIKYVGSIQYFVHTSRVMKMPVHLSWWISGQLRSCHRSGLQSSSLWRRSWTGLWEKTDHSFLKFCYTIKCHKTYSVCQQPSYVLITMIMLNLGTLCTTNFLDTLHCATIHTKWWTSVCIN